MDVHILHRKDEIHDFLRSDPELQAYCMGDLDDFFWPKTVWYGLMDKGTLLSVALLYTGSDYPTLLLFYKDEEQYPYLLLEKIRTLLPNKFYAHLNEGLVDVFGRQNVIQYYGLSYKMALRGGLQGVDDKHVSRLTESQLGQINEFYANAYPDNWFDSRMLETGKYFGYFDGEKLVGIAGIHVYSAEYKVAALGNIATHPDYRGKQIAYKLTSHLCNDLKETVDAIGLNVKADNEYAIKCYRKIGFEIIGTYEECFIKNDIK
jgi:ribosomal protein S18 acetylase RimI-like enzyme